MNPADAAKLDADRQIVVTRLLDAPREMVYGAWTQPAQIAQWWGPDGFTNTIHEMDVRPGGTWRFVMHGPDGKDYPNRIVFIEVDPPARLFYAHGEDHPDRDAGGEEFRPSFHALVTFEEQNTAGSARTRLTLRLLFDSVGACRRVKEFGAVEGGRQTLERLAAYLVACVARSPLAPG